MPNSMTGFARQETQNPWGDCCCEIRSVNHRHLEVNMRLPDALRLLEDKFRRLLRSSLSRGKVDVTIQLNAEAAQLNELNIDMHRVEQLAQAVRQIESVVGVDKVLAIDPFKLLQWPGVIRDSALDTNDVHLAVTTLFTETLTELVGHRQREGNALAAEIEKRLALIDEEIVKVRKGMPDILHNHREKIQQRLQLLTTTVNAERLEQEVALLASKADIDEELDRLATHVKEINYLLEQSGPIGRRLDFMMQECNREANTLSSKSLAIDTTQAAVSLKVLIEQMREQIQNIE